MNRIEEGFHALDRIAPGDEEVAEIRDDRIVAGVYRYIQTALAATTGTDPATVYTLGFRRTWSGRGDDFGPPELHSIGGSYPILSVHVTP